MLLNGKVRSDSDNVFYKMGGAAKTVIAIGFLTCACPGEMSHRIDQNTSTNWVSSAENEALTIVIIHRFYVSDLTESFPCFLRLHIT